MSTHPMVFMNARITRAFLHCDKSVKVTTHAQCKRKNSNLKDFTSDVIDLHFPKKTNLKIWMQHWNTRCALPCIWSLSHSVVHLLELEQEVKSCNITSWNATFVELFALHLHQCRRDCTLKEMSETVDIVQNGWWMELHGLRHLRIEWYVVHMFYIDIFYLYFLCIL